MAYFYPREALESYHLLCLNDVVMSGRGGRDVANNYYFEGEFFFWMIGDGYVNGLPTNTHQKGSKKQS
jgi:hypothetical protein